MNRWLMIGSLAGLLVVSTGCLHHNTRKGCSTGDCASGGCATGTCSTGDCGAGPCTACGGAGSCSTGSCNACGGSGLCNTLSGCGCCNGARTGCVAGKIGWQQGGHDYSSHLRPGLLGHHSGQRLNSRPFTAGPPTGQVAYPYYTVRGPRDFLLNDPPTIGR